MALDLEKLRKGRQVLQKMGQGINPIDGEPIQTDSFLQDPRIIRCLFFAAEVLGMVADGTLIIKDERRNFSITDEEKARICLPDGPIGINQFARCVNEVLSPSSKRLTGVIINNGLKELGILTEVVDPNGKKRTTITAKSAQYGISTEPRVYNGAEYEAVLYDDSGKLFLLNNLEQILGRDPAVLRQDGSCNG